MCPKRVMRIKEAIAVMDMCPSQGEGKEQEDRNDEMKIALQLRFQVEPNQERHARPYTPPCPAAPADPNEVVLFEEAPLREAVPWPVIGM
jgi:hypothetical protein